MSVPNVDQFEVYFRRADLDGDGRISGAEAVGFFQGSGLPKNVLAQIWAHADQSHNGFLGRQEFYNALKLVTVAQSKRELTPDIVKAALYGPAAAKIPPPQINLAAVPAHQFNSMAAAPASKTGSISQTTSQGFGFRGPGLPNASMNQQFFPSPQSHSMRPTQAMPASGVPHPSLATAGPEYRVGNLPSQNQAMPSAIAARPPQTVSPSIAGPGMSGPNSSNDWFSGRTGGSSTELRGISPSTVAAASKPQTVVAMSSQPTTNDSRSLVISGNGFPSDSVFGGDMFSVNSSQKQGPSYSASSAPASSAVVPVSTEVQPSSKRNALDSLQSSFSMQPTGSTTSPIVPVSRGPQPSARTNSLDSLQSAFSMQPTGSQLPHTRPSMSSGQQVAGQTPASLTASGTAGGVGNSNSGNSQFPWPKMKPSDVQKYSKVFMEVDIDRDGKITGEQARNLFLSWRLPREVLKQVWDLSDQDNDSMLSLREFCFALYLMERYREGRPLPAALPNNAIFDETLLSMTGQQNANYGNTGWTSRPGFGQPLGTGPQPVTPATGIRPPIPRTAPHTDSGLLSGQQKPKDQVFDDSFSNQLANGEQNSVNSQFQEATSAVKKGEEKENLILDSKEKIEFYRSKMQDIVLYKSRCDNRLNEITERASADKREAETLTKKYEEKYKQVAEVASKLTIEDARFREIQGRKTELHHAIVNMEQGGSADGILQVRADRIQSDLEELMKVLTERCKKHGIDVKPKALIEIPFGWQPGIQGGAALWDEDWDKFEDEGFVNELKFDAKDAPVSPNEKSASVHGDNGSADDSFTPDSLSNLDEKPRHFPSTGERPMENESLYTLSEDELVRSPQSSPAARFHAESPSSEYSDIHHGKSSEADAETHRSFDESTWGAFENNDDTDSVWGFNTVKTKDSDSERHRDYFGSSDFGINPIRTDSPSSESAFHRKSPFAFDDSVPGTPLSKFGNSPPRFSEASRDNFDSFSRFDSFNMNDGGFSQQPERLTRFDSMNSTKDFGGFSRFDSINSSRDFGERLTRFDSMSSSRDFGAERLTRFDSMNSSKDFGGNHAFTFDDSDPFGSSGPFKVSSENRSPKKGSDGWNAF